jgi:hypothetical protein
LRRIYGAKMRMEKNTYVVLFKQKYYGDEIKEYENGDENGGNRFLRSVGNELPGYTASYSRRLSHSHENFNISD